VDFTTTITVSGDVNENEPDEPSEIESSAEMLTEPFDAIKAALEANLQHPATTQLLMQCQRKLSKHQKSQLHAQQHVQAARYVAPNSVTATTAYSSHSTSETANHQSRKGQQRLLRRKLTQAR
jgi:hypothetical protein